MTVNHDVVGSSPTCGVFFFVYNQVFIGTKFAALAQSVEHFHGKEGVTSSNLVSGFCQYNPI